MKTEHLRHLGLTLCLLGLLSACGTPDERPADSPTAACAEQAPASQWLLEKGRILPLDTGQSRIAVRVYRAGRLAQLGHNHVLEVGELRGSLKQLEGGGGLAELVFGVDSLVVDDPAARARAGADFARQPGARAVAGTRRNMLGKEVLDAVAAPEVRISARVMDLAAAHPLAEVSVCVRGISRRYETAVVTETRETEVRVSGVLSLRQSDFGIRPFAVLGGALQVRDDIQADFLIVGRKSGVAM